MATSPTHANISKKWSFIKYIASKTPGCSSNQFPIRNAAPRNTINPSSFDIILNPL